MMPLQLKTSPHCFNSLYNFFTIKRASWGMGLLDGLRFTYALADQEEYQQMKSNITTVLDAILNNI
jgi:hypothetical protein